MMSRAEKVILSFRYHFLSTFIHEKNILNHQKNKMLGNEANSKIVSRLIIYMNFHPSFFAKKYTLISFS